MAVGCWALEEKYRPWSPDPAALQHDSTYVVGWLASSRFVRSLWLRVSEVEEREEEEEGIHSRGFRREQESTRRGRERERNRRRERGGGRKRLEKGRQWRSQETRTQSPLRLGSFSTLLCADACFLVFFSVLFVSFLCGWNHGNGIKICIFTICMRGAPGCRVSGYIASG
uniref:Uncharacterized protein n=1 Tax=Oryza barthii TaxID=65489 RepID=A0A0D3HA89_9ORYZ